MPTATDLWDTVTRAHKPLPSVRYSFRVDGWRGPPWHVRRVELVEAISEPYRLTVELVVDEPRLKHDDLLGDVCALELDRKTSTRTVHGVVLSATDLGRSAGRHHVRLEVGPALALLAQRNDTRAWQDRSAPDILKDVLSAPLAELGRTVKLDALRVGDYPRREYCVQFRESDLAFAARLMEEEGISYFFDHSGDAEKLVLVDDNHDFAALQGDTPVAIRETEPDTAAAESVQRFSVGRRMRSSAVAQRNFDWQSPQAPRAAGRPGTDHRGRTREVYEHDDTVYPGDGERVAKLKQERLDVGAHAASGKSNVTGLYPGAWFALQGHARADLDDKYLVTRVTHRGEAPEVNIMMTQASAGPPYANEFEVIPLKVPYRPMKLQAKPKVSGLQTATVTGPPGEEVHCDEHGRIKILPHWDRMSPQDETSSWWVRCAQALAGSGWGFFALPRIGMEVVVDFLDGDPDRPLVVGCVYNGQNQPPYPLPAEKTKTTLKSNSSPGGGGSNELRFEDQAGAEEVYLHAQMTFNAVVGADMSLSVGGSESDSISANRSTSVGANDSTAVGANSSLAVGANISSTAGANHSASAAATQSFSAGASQSLSAGSSQSLSAGSSQSLSAGSSQSLSAGSSQSLSAGADQSISVGANRTVTVTGNETVSVTGTQSTSVTGAHSLTTSAASTVDIGAALTHSIGADYTLSITANNTVTAVEYSLTASKITLSGGGSLITMEGGKISISSSGPLELGGCGPITITGPDISLKGGPINIDGADVTVKGGTIKLN